MNKKSAYAEQLSHRHA